MSATCQQPVILFDGVCNLCAWAVRFIIERDPEARFLFASLQSECGQRPLTAHRLDPANMDSFILIEEGRAYQQSTAALKVARHLSGPWPLFYACIVLPALIRDAFYRFIAPNRYHWFGRQESCMIPTPKLRSRFLF